MWQPAHVKPTASAFSPICGALTRVTWARESPTGRPQLYAGSDGWIVGLVSGSQCTGRRPDPASPTDVTSGRKPKRAR